MTAATKIVRLGKQQKLGTLVELLRNEELVARALGRNGGLAFDEMRGLMTVAGQPLGDVDLTRLRLAAEAAESTHFADSDVHSAAMVVARDSDYHPVRRYLTSLAWDGQPRLQELKNRLGLSSDHEAHYVRLLFLSAAKRGLHPGTKVDTVVVLVGEQGCGKSTFVRILGGDFFSDEGIHLEDKDTKLLIRRTWILEWAELRALQGRSAESVKAFLSQTVDSFRPPYGRSHVDVPRTCIVVGTTNRDDFLTDSTGNRRFLPVRVGRIDTEWVQANRDQLFAEAVHCVRAGEPHWLTPEAAARHAQHAVQFESGDAWTDAVLTYIGTRSWVTIAEVLSNALELPPGRSTKQDEGRVVNILKANGWEKDRKRLEPGGEPVRHWVPKSGRRDA